MSTLCKFAAIQMCSTDNRSANLATAEKLIAEAKKQQADYVLLPENFAFMGKNDADKLAIGDKKDGIIPKFLQTMAKQYQITVIGGTYPLSATKEKTYAACEVYNPHGQELGCYKKMHLFDVHLPATGQHYTESTFTEPGTTPVMVTTPHLNIGLSICYDLRFPELYRALLMQGSQLFCIPSAFTEETGRAHWEILLKARAIENLNYVVASAQTGLHANGRKTYGHSMIIDPWGKTIAHLSQEIGVITAEIDLEYLTSLRQQFPAVAHRVLF